MNLDTFSACFIRAYDCAMIAHTQLFFLSRYSDIISLLTITVWGVSNKHFLLPFFICSNDDPGVTLTYFTATSNLVT